MSDSDRNGNAWVVRPSQYLETRPPSYALPAAPRSHYVAMRDGCRLAVDVYLPEPAEREDYREIADWIVAQPWSDGTIGATGISYVGAACDFLASTGHTAVKAVAPLFAVWDTWGDHYYPGGLLQNQLAKTYDELMV